MAGINYYNPATGGAPASTNPVAAGQNLGYLNNSQVGTDQWGTGDSFQGAGRQGVLAAAEGGMSGTNQNDVSAQNQLRSYYQNDLADLPGNTANGISSFDTQAQRGLSNLLSNYGASQAGSGTMGSRQYAGATGNIANQAGSNYMTGLINARQNATTQAGQIGSGLSGIANTDMAQQNQQFAQGQGLAGDISGLMGLDQQRQGQLNQISMQQSANNNALLGDVVKGGAAAGGMMLAGPAGAAGAAALAGSAMPSTSAPMMAADPGNGFYAPTQSIGQANGMYPSANAGSSPYGY